MKWLGLVALILILLLASILRVREIGHDSLWGDEALTLLLAKMPLHDLVKYDTWFEQIPPAHHLIVHFWIMIFGASEASARMPSAIAGVLGVWMMYVLVARLMGRWAGLAAALMLAVSPMHLAYSQETRAYTLLVLVSLISCDLFVRLLRKPSPRLHLAYVLVSTLLLYTHLYGIFTIAAQHLVYAAVCLRDRREHRPTRLKLRRWFTDNLAIAALFSPWVPTVIEWTHLVEVRFWVKQVTLDDISRAYWVYSGSTAAFVLMVALITIGIWRWMRTGQKHRRRDTGMLMLMALAAVPVVVPVIISVLTMPSFSPRYGIVACTGFSALAGIGILALRPWPLRVLVLAVVAAISPLGHAADIPRTDWRAVGNYLNKNMRAGDMAVIHLRAGSRLYEYYVHRPDVQFRPIDVGSIPVSLPLAPGRHVWLILYDEVYTAQDFLRRAPWHIERRFVMHPNVLIMELVDRSQRTKPPPTTRPASNAKP